MTSVISLGRYLSTRLVFFVFPFFLYFTLIHAYEVVEPNTYSCGPGYGNPLIRWPCEIALSDMPTGSVPETFSTKAKSQDDDWIQLPRRYVDDTTHPACVITIDLEGHSQTDRSVMISWDIIGNIARNVMDHCVIEHSWGGWETYGLDATFRALVPPAAYDGSTRPQPAAVENPDGSIDSLGLPEGAGGVDGFSKLPL